MHRVIPYFNFLIFSFVLWNSSFPAAGDESIIKKNLTEKISLRAKSKRIPEVCLAGEFKAHFHWTEKLGTRLVAILQASDWKQRVEHTSLNKLVHVGPEKTRDLRPDTEFATYVTDGTDF